MFRIAFLSALFTLFNVVSSANEIDYSNCRSIQEVLARETQEISSTDLTDHDELAELYVSREESYLLDVQYDKAVEDFQSARYHVGYCCDVETAMVVVFRASFGEVVGFDNRPLSKFHLPAKIALFRKDKVSFFSHVPAHCLKKETLSFQKIIDFFKQSEFRKRSIL